MKTQLQVKGTPIIVSAEINAKLNTVITVKYDDPGSEINAGAFVEIPLEAQLLKLAESLKSPTMSTAAKGLVTAIEAYIAKKA